MKNLTRIFFCTFVVASLYSCEPEELLEDGKLKVDFRKETIGETGDQKDVKQEIEI